MSISSSIGRASLDYFKRNGLNAQADRSPRWPGGKTRRLFSSRSVLFYCDLSMLRLADWQIMPSSLKVERHNEVRPFSVRRTSKRSPVSGILTWPAAMSKSALS